MARQAQKEHELIVNMCIEARPNQMDKIIDEILDAMIDVCEKHKACIGGGISYRDCIDFNEPKKRSKSSKSSI
jgi:hypothetical protein